MYMRPGSRWMTPPHESAMVRLGMPARPRPVSLMAARRLSALGQGDAPPPPLPAINLVDVAPGRCVEAPGEPMPPPGVAPAYWWPPWWAGWSAWRAARQERMPTMYTRPGSAWMAPPGSAAWMAPPHERAMARLGQVPPRPDGAAPPVVPSEPPTLEVLWEWLEEGRAVLSTHEEQLRAGGAMLATHAEQLRAGAAMLTEHEKRLRLLERLSLEPAATSARPPMAARPIPRWRPWWALSGAWLAPPHETAMARLGMLPARPRPPSLMAARRLSALGQDEWAFFNGGEAATFDLGVTPLAFEMPALEIPAVETSWWDQATSWFPSAETWGTIGTAAGTVIQAATPLAMPLLQQAIFGTPAPTGLRPPAPAGYTYSPTGQLVRAAPAPAGYTYSPTGQLVPAPARAGWTMPVLLLGGAAVIGGALYMTAGRRRRSP